MALLQDRVQETTTTAGTGTFALGGAVTGYVTFNSVFTNGNIVWYTCDDGAGNWEIGTGTVGTGTLTRSVFQSSNGGSLVNFAAGTKRLFCSAPYSYYLPNQTGNSGKILTTDGNVSSWTSSVPSGLTFTDVIASGGVWAQGALGASYTSGIVSDYTTNLGRISVGTSASLAFYTGGVGTSELMRLTSTGLGIGTSSPAGKLTISSSTNNGLYVTDGTVVTILYNSSSAYGTVGTVTNHPMTFWTNNSLKMTLDSSGNLGLGVTPSAWGTGKAFEISGAGAGLSAGYGDGLNMHQNVIYNSGYKYAGNAYAVRYAQTNGQHQWFTAPSGTAGNAISFTQAMTLDQSGNLGIGTTSAVSKLHVNSASTAITYATVGNNNGGMQIGVDTSGFSVVSSYSANPIRFGNSSATTFVETMRIDSSGNVGIGTSSPVVKLDVNGVGRMRFSSGTGAGHWLDTTGNASRFFVGTDAITEAWRVYDSIGGGNRIYLDSSGNVGIGTSSPTEKLTVSTSANAPLLGVFSNTNAGASAYAATKITSNDGNLWSIVSSAAGGGGSVIYSDNATGVFNLRTYNAIPLTFGTANTERMRIDASGNLGVGTSSPYNWGGASISTGSYSSTVTYGIYGANNYYNSGWKYGGNGISWGIGNNFGGVTNGVTIAVATSNSGGAGAALTWNPAFNIDTSGNVGIGTASPAVKLAVSSTDAILVPVGTTAQRPTAATGYLRFNTSSSAFEGYNGTSWGSLGGATGGGADAVFYLNGKTVTTTYSIPSGQNAHSVGPITVNSGVTVTIPSGSRWVIS